MPTTYTPGHSYNDQLDPTRINPFFHIFEVLDEVIHIYTFRQWFKLDSSDRVVDPSTNSIWVRNNPFLVHVTPAAKFFEASINPAFKSNDINKPPFVDQVVSVKGNILKNVIKYTDIVSLNKFNYYSTNELDLENLYLEPIHADDGILNKSFRRIDPNIDYVITYNGVDGAKAGYEKENIAERTKSLMQGVLSFNVNDLLHINSGFGAAGNMSKMSDCNICIGPAVTNFMCNLTLDNGIVRSQNFNYAFDFTKRLKLKVEGPTTANVGDIVSYTVTLMNYNFTDTWTNPPTIEMYPTTTAGHISHRKLTLVNGTGQFKVDTSLLSSGESFTVKANWKYITDDSSVTTQLI